MGGEKEFCCGVRIDVIICCFIRCIDPVKSVSIQLDVSAATRRNDVRLSRYM